MDGIEAAAARLAGEYGIHVIAASSLAMVLTERIPFSMQPYGFKWLWARIGSAPRWQDRLAYL
jgi:hypothetical protein